MKKIIVIMLLVVTMAGIGCNPAIKPEKIEVSGGSDKVYFPTKKDQIADSIFLSGLTFCRYNLFKFDGMYLFRGAASGAQFYSVYDPDSRLYVFAISKKEPYLNLKLSDSNMVANVANRYSPHLQVLQDERELWTEAEGFGKATEYNVNVYLFDEAFTAQIVNQGLEVTDAYLNDETHPIKERDEARIRRKKILESLFRRQAKSLLSPNKCKSKGWDMICEDTDIRDNYRKGFNKKFGFSNVEFSNGFSLRYNDKEAGVHEMVMKIAKGLKDPKFQKELAEWMK